MKAQTVSTVAELLAASQDAGIRTIELRGEIVDVPPFTLGPLQTLTGAGIGKSVLQFSKDADGLRLTSGNTVRDLALHASPDKRAIWNDDSQASLGTLVLNNLSVTGQVQLLASNQIRSGHVEVDGLDILSADTTFAGTRPHAYGVSVLQGAFTLWNQQADSSVLITSTLTNISVGRLATPVLGSGILISGAGGAGGRVHVEQLESGAIYSNGSIPPGTPDLISGGVFVCYDVAADLVRNLGPVTTYGPNDMALDNWGSVDRWIALQKITTLGPSGIGFVNFGRLGVLRVEAPIETLGTGARGFNVYTGTVAFAEFDRIVTHGDGAVAVQIAQPVGELRFKHGIETFGGIGPSLVKGVVQTLSAVPLSIKPGGSARKIVIGGGLRSHGKDTAVLEQLGSIDELHISGGFSNTSPSQ